MVATSSTAASYDFIGLTALKMRARSKSPEAVNEVARQFEALFVQMMLKSMRDASLGEGLFDSQQMRTYQEMFDREVALSLANGRGIGLADVIARQLASERGEAVEPQTALPAIGHALPPVSAVAPVVPAAGVAGDHAPTVPDTAWAVKAAAALPAAPAESAPAITPPQAATGTDYTDPQAFVAAVWDDAERAARQLGANPEVLVAQAALETGWGRAVARREDGSSSHNLFNIKAQHGWDGDTVRVRTLEFVDGVAERRTEPFRAYDSPRASFDDYIALVSGSGRYAQAQASAGDDAAYVGALADAGYATDPHYADKILAILGGETLRDAIDGLKFSGGRSL